MLFYLYGFTRAFYAKLLLAGSSLQLEPKYSEAISMIAPASEAVAIFKGCSSYRFSLSLNTPVLPIIRLVTPAFLTCSSCNIQL